MRTFLDRVISNKLYDLARERYAKKRKGLYRSLSLEELLGREDPRLADKFLKDYKSLNQLRKDELSELVISALEKLSSRQKELCRLLGASLSIREAGRHLKIPKSTVHDEMRRIKEIFKKEGLEDYLSSDPAE